MPFLDAANPDPGTTVAGRYRLERRLVDVTHVALWRGHDEVLDRPVAVRLVAADHPRAAAVLAAARSTATVDDRRVARVLDADDGAEHAFVYVVTAWAAGTDLSTLLADGPLEPDEALALVGEVAEVVTYAHERGVPHLALDPTNVVVGAGDEVTLLGLAVDAVLWGRPVAEPPRADARGLGALLYCGLTARWPWPGDGHGLDTAPSMAGRLCTPHQVRAAVPSGVDVLCRRALGEDLGAGPLDSPDAVAAAIRELTADRGRPRWRPTAWFGRGARTAARS